jgi:hypothetical protein
MVAQDVDKTVKATTNQTKEEDVVTNVEVVEGDLQLNHNSRYLLGQEVNGVMPKMARLNELFIIYE